MRSVPKRCARRTWTGGRAYLVVGRGGDHKMLWFGGRNGSKRCAQWFEALRRARNGSEGSKVEGGEMSALHPYGGGCAPAAGPSSVVAEPEEPRITRMTPIGKAVGRKGAKGKIREEQIRREGRETMPA